MIKLLRLSTVQGRMALMMIVFIVSLILFSAFTYYQTRNMERAYRTLAEEIHKIDVQRFAHNLELLIVQNALAETIQRMDTIDRGRVMRKIQKARVKTIDEFEKDFITIGSSGYEPLLDTLRAVWSDIDLIAQQVYADVGTAYTTDSARNQARQTTFKTYSERISKVVARFYPLLYKHGITKLTMKAQKEVREDLDFYTTLSVRFIVIASGLICIVVVFLWLQLRKTLVNSIRPPTAVLERLSQGILSEPRPCSGNELDTIVTATNQLNTSLQEAAQFAQAVGKGNFDYAFTSLGEQDQLGNALVQMRDEIKALTERETQRHWISQGESQVAELLRKTDLSSEKVVEQTLSWIIRYVNANQGVLFSYQPEEETLQALAYYAYDRKKYIKKEIKIGEGLIGQCYLERAPVYMTDLPPDYVTVTSGLGQTTPRSLLVVPLLIEDQVEGVLELAAFHAFTEAEQLLVTNISVIIASYLSTLRHQQRTTHLLEELQEKSGKLSAQEEELRQNLEEMQATHEEMRRREEHYQQQIAALQADNPTE